MLERNADYFKPGVPKLDRIDVRDRPGAAGGPARACSAARSTSWATAFRRRKFLEVKNSPEWGDNIVTGGQLHTGYVTMNVNVPPFDKQEVRQAVNTAINKDRIVRIINGRAVPANQPLPPSMPGYAKDYQGYAYDPAKAKELLQAAGVGDGFETELYATNTDPNPRIAQAIQQDLAAVGIKAELRTLAQANVIAAGGEKQGAPMIWSGGMAWIADFPDPSNFYGPILGCARRRAGRLELVLVLQQGRWTSGPPRPTPWPIRRRAASALALWRDIFVDDHGDAPWAPVFNEQRFTMKSDRLGGPDAIFVDPVHIPVHYDEVYAKDAQ